MLNGSQGVGNSGGNINGSQGGNFNGNNNVGNNSGTINYYNPTITSVSREGNGDTVIQFEVKTVTNYRVSGVSSNSNNSNNPWNGPVIVDNSRTTNNFTFGNITAGNNNTVSSIQANNITNSGSGHIQIGTGNIIGANNTQAMATGGHSTAFVNNGNNNVPPPDNFDSPEQVVIASIITEIKQSANLRAPTVESLPRYQACINQFVELNQLEWEEEEREAIDSMVKYVGRYGTKADQAVREIDLRLEKMLGKKPATTLELLVVPDNSSASSSNNAPSNHEALPSAQPSVSSNTTNNTARSNDASNVNRSTTSVNASANNVTAQPIQTPAESAIRKVQDYYSAIMAQLRLTYGQVPTSIRNLLEQTVRNGTDVIAGNPGLEDFFADGCIEELGLAVQSYVP